MKNGTVLIVDDHKQVLKALGQLIEEEFEAVLLASNPNQIPSLVAAGNIDVVLLDMNFSASINTGNEGLFWLRKIKKLDPSIVVVMITAFGEINLAVQAMKAGATDFILKPWDNDKLMATLKAAYQLKQKNKEIKSLQNKQKHLREQLNKPYEQLIGASEPLEEVRKVIKKVAGTNTNVLISGENGTGKELIARELHRLSKRANDILVSVDMGSLSESLFESELFGHVKGAYTDAKEDRIGRFEAASGGSMFLDEIGNLSLSMQSKLLSVLQNKEVIRVGSNKTIPVDIRLITATNKDLHKLVQEGLFREDLLYRINTIEIKVPPLRDRGQDIELLALHFLDRYRNKYEKPLLKINNKAYEKLAHYQWPGNIRELQHTIEKSVILSESNILGPANFLLQGNEITNEIDSKPKTLEDIEKKAIKNALKNNAGNIVRAATELGLARQTLYNKIAKYGI